MAAYDLLLEKLRFVGYYAVLFSLYYVLCEAV